VGGWGEGVSAPLRQKFNGREFFVNRLEGPPPTPTPQDAGCDSPAATWNRTHPGRSADVTAQPARWAGESRALQVVLGPTATDIAALPPGRYALANVRWGKLTAPDVDVEIRAG
jgi:hypothetical protein